MHHKTPPGLPSRITHHASRITTIQPSDHLTIPPLRSSPCKGPVARLCLVSGADGRHPGGNRPAFPACQRLNRLNLRIEYQLACPIGPAGSRIGEGVPVYLGLGPEGLNSLIRSSISSPHRRDRRCLVCI